MATLVFFHAHPDDEAIATGGSMAKAAADGHRVVLVVATKGEHGEVAENVLAPGEELWQRRVQETAEAARILGVAHHHFLGYTDSGMAGTPENDHPASFWQAPVEEAAERLARILADERADVLTVYDENGVYGHPDHVQVHRVGVRAAELAGTPLVFESTYNRDEIFRQMAALGGPDEVPIDNEGMAEFGLPESRITTAVDVSALLDVKRKAMAAHASQISDTSWFLSLDDDQFAAAFGTEWFVRRGADRSGPPFEASLLEGLA